MDVLFILVPLSVVLVIAILGVFAWALRNGQLDDLEREGLRILRDDQEVPRELAGVDGDQVCVRAKGKQSP
jgi:cbb3-type cytochrome oxidase maturation protein